MPTPKLTAEIITAAIEGFESQKRRIDGQIAELRAMLPGGPAESAATPELPTRRRKTFSAASRRKMAAALKKRWATKKAEAAKAQPAAAKNAAVKKVAAKKTTAKKTAPTPAAAETTDQ